MEYSIPLFDLNFDQNEEIAVLETLKSKWISIGPKSQEFESNFASLLGVNHAISIANCTAALHLALIALDIKPGDEILCPSLSFAATANCIKYVGATPVFCDINSLENPTISIDEIRHKTTEKTKAIIVMHYGGYACEMDFILEFAKNKKLRIIEDACHAPLSEYNGVKLGTIGDIGCFSFFSNKNISTGEGGMIITNDPAIADKVKLLRSHGMTTMSYERSKGHATTYDIVELGFNFRMDDIRSSIGIVQLKKLENDLLNRASVRREYLMTLKDENRIIIPFNTNKEYSSNYIFPIVLKNSEVRDIVREKLHEAGIQTSVHYPPIHRFTIYQNEFTDLPITDLYSRSTITLPMFGSLNIESVHYITNTLIKILNEL